VLNGRTGVSETTRELVQQAMDDLGYRPTTARADEPGLAMIRLTAIFADMASTMYNPMLLQAIVDAATEYDSQIIVRLVGHVDSLPVDNASGMKAWARSLLGGGCQGAIFVTCNLSKPQIDACEQIGLPLLAVDCHTLLDAGITSISANNFSGGYAQAEHLIKLGHRRIGLIIGHQDSTFARERAYGFRAALRDNAMELPDELVYEGDFWPETGLAAARKFLSLPDPPTAIASNCDGGALGVVEAAHEFGLSVPKDLSLIGYDNTPEATWCVPKLTTISQPLTEIGRWAVRNLLRLVRGEQPDSQHVQLATSLVLRESTAPPAR
jgi:LacI family transcriptional regulator